MILKRESIFTEGYIIFPIQFEKKKRNSLAVQWLGPHASTAAVTGSVPAGATKILNARQRGQKKKKKKSRQKFQEKIGVAKLL